MSSNTIKYDDPFAFVQPVQDGETAITFPFIKNGDRATRIYTRTILQRESSYQPIAPGTETDSVWPGGDPKAYNFPDSTPARVGVGDLLRFTRSYARIPGAQVSYPGSKYIQLPQPVNNYASVTSLITYKWSNQQSDVGAGYFDQNAGYIYTNHQNAIYGSIKQCSYRKIGTASAGTFTLTYGANTTAALNWNDTGATIATAINGLASVTAAGLTASATNYLATATGGMLFVVWTGNATATAITMNAASLTVSTSKNPVTTLGYAYGGGYTFQCQTIALPDHVTITSHGFDTSKALATTNQPVTVAANIVVLASGEWGSIDANTIWAPTHSGGAYSWAGTYSRAFAPGKTRLMRTRVTDTYFLPGVSTGITTAADISVPTGMQDPADFISSLATSTGWQTYSSEGPTKWGDSQIYCLSTTEINLDDT